MKTSRTDIKRNKQLTKLGYSAHKCMGYSKCTLYYGDHFLYEEKHTDGSTTVLLAKYHGRIKPLNQINKSDPTGWRILAQSCNTEMTFTFERWIDPKDVIRTNTGKGINPHIEKFFQHQIEKNGY